MNGSGSIAEKTACAGRSSCSSISCARRLAGISERDWQLFIGHLNATLDKFLVAKNEKADVLAFIESTKKDIVE